MGNWREQCLGTFICNDSLTAIVALLINYTTGYPNYRAILNEHSRFQKRKGLKCKINNRLKLCFNSRSPIQRLSGFSMPACLPGGDDHHTHSLLWLQARSEWMKSTWTDSMKSTGTDFRGKCDVIGHAIKKRRKKKAPGPECCWTTTQLVVSGNVCLYIYEMQHRELYI